MQLWYPHESGYCGGLIMSPQPEYWKKDIEDLVALIMDEDSPLKELKSLEEKR